MGFIGGGSAGLNETTTRFQHPEENEQESGTDKGHQDVSSQATDGRGNLQRGEDPSSDEGADHTDDNVSKETKSDPAEQ